MGSDARVSGPARLRSWLGTRTNTSPANTASWVVAVGILAAVIPASEKVAENQVFFAAHGVPSWAWIVLVVGVTAVGWLALTGLLLLMRRWLSPAGYDVAATVLMLVVTWFFVGNVLSRTLFAGAPVLGPVVGLLVAGGVTLLARRVAMGTVLVVFAAAAAAVPLVTSAASAGEPGDRAALVFDEDANRPSILWIVSDELQYPLVFTQDGDVRPEFPNIARLADQATTYTKAYAGANYTDYAVPAMLNGISDVAAVGPDAMQQVRAGIGVVPALASEYAVAMESPIYSFDCETEDCASVGSQADISPWQRYWGFAADTAAIAGRTALAQPFSDLFPSLDGKWRDFWAGGDEFGDDAEGDTVGAVIDSVRLIEQNRPGTPWFAFWHTIRTHAPWVLDREGVPIYPSRVPIVDGAHMIGAEADQTYTTDELKRLQRRLYAASAIDFDRQLGQVLDELEASGAYDDTMIVLTADHGATMTERSDRRVGDDLVQRWSEVAHVPLVVKAPGQAEPQRVTEPRSTGQIAATVLQTAGADPAEATRSPGLDSDLPGGPVFTTVAGGVLTPWRYEGIAEVDPWLPEDLTPPDAEHPFAVGVDSALLGGAVPDGWVEVAVAEVQALPGESTQQALIVDRASAACPADTTVGLVSVADRVVGSVLWEGPNGSTTDQTRGWAIVPRADVGDYRFWCPTTG
jgi:hypothetical protein